MIFKVLRKIKYLLLFLSCFFLCFNVHAETVTITPNFQLYRVYQESTILSSSAVIFGGNNNFWTSSTAYPQGPGVPSSPTDPRSFSWSTTSNYCYSSTDGRNHGGKMVGVIGINMASTFVDDLSSIIITAGGQSSSCTFGYYNGNTSLAQFTCYSNSFENFSIDYSYNRSPQRIIGSQPLIMRQLQVDCNFDDLAISTSINEQTTNIINNNNSNTHKIGKWITDLGGSIGTWFGQLGNKIGGFFDNLLNFFKDDSTDSPDDNLNNLNNKVATNSVISDLLLLPVKFLQNFVNALGGSCTQFSLGNLYGTDLFMPCVNIGGYLGTGIWTTIDLILSGFFVYYLRKKFVEIYYNITNLKNGGNEVD